MSDGIERLFDESLVMKVEDPDKRGLCIGIQLSTSTPIMFYPLNYHPVRITGWEGLPLFSR